jgi:FAD/FMN-containing dehydrogenase
MWRSKQRLSRRRLAASIAAATPPMEWKFPAKAAAELQQKVQGSVVVGSDTNYHAARQAFVANYQAFPQIIVYCEVFSDVAEALAFAREWELSPVCRAGGHSTAGYSVNNGMVIDVSRLSYVVVDRRTNRAVVGAGTNFGHLNAALDAYGLHLPSGGCDDVAIAGYMMGGGFGYTSQIFGMNCDSMIEALVMLADGSIVVASKRRNPDLFWALRGGGGGNFGILLQITFQLHDLGPVWGFGIRWRAGHGADGAKRVAAALDVLQGKFTGEEMPHGLGHQSTINFIDDEPYLLLRGVYTGDPVTGRALLKPLLNTEGAELDLDRVGGYTEINNYLNSTPEVPLVAPHTPNQSESRYIGRKLTRAEWGSIVSLFQRSPNRGNFFGIEGYGGAIAALAPTSTAFWHRKALFDVYTWVFWQDEQEENASLAFLDDFRQVLKPCSNGHAYQNYPNRQNYNYRWMYWGKNFPALVKIKHKYDQTNLFSFGQTISPVPVYAGVEIIRPKGGAGPHIRPEIDILATSRSHSRI